MKKRRFAEGGSSEDEDKAEGLRRSAGEKVGFLKRLRMGNIDDPESEAYKQFGAGRGRADRAAAAPAPAARPPAAAPAPMARPPAAAPAAASADSEDFIEAGSGVGDVVRKPTPAPALARPRPSAPAAAQPTAKPPAPMRVGTGSGRGGQGGAAAGEAEAYRAQAKAPAPAPAPVPAPAPASASVEDKYSANARLKRALGTAEMRANTEPDIKAADIAAAKAAGDAKRAKYREDILTPIKKLAARVGTQEMREKYKAEGYAKGGSVRGDGICQRGKTRGKFV